MTSEAQPANGGGQISKLRRTLTLPLSKMKSRGGSFHTPHKLSEDNNYATKSENEDVSERKRPHRGNNLTQSMRSSSGRKHDIRVSRVNPHLIRNASDGDPNDPTQPVGKFPSPDNNDASSASDHQSKKGKKKRPRYRRWPTQTLARVLDVNLLKRIGSSRRNEHAGTVLRNVTVSRSPGDTLGIYIKEVNSGSSNSLVNSSQSRSHVLISRLAPGSIAERQGILKKGDEILCVNDRDVKDLSLTEVAASMDYHSRLILSVRSKYLHANNNNDKVDTTQSDFQTTSQCATTPQDDCPFSPPTITVTRDFLTPSSQVPDASTTSTGVGSTRDEAIPSVYDNNFPSSLVTTVPSPDDEQPPPIMTVQHQLELKYNEAWKILLNAIDSFETRSGTSGIANETTQPSRESYWSPLKEIISSVNSDKNLSAATHSWTENDNLSATSDSTTTSMSTTPFFPSVSELPITDDPDYDEVAMSEFDGEEDLEVDGCARLYSPYRRSHSVSSSTSGSIHSSDPGNSWFTVPSNSTTTTTTLSPGFTRGSQNDIDDSKQRSRGDLSQDGVKNIDSTCPDMQSPEISTSVFFSQDPSPRNPPTGITVGQCRNWLDRGKEISAELKLRIVGGDPSMKNPNVVQPTKDDNGRTSSESSSATSTHSPKIITLPQAHDMKTLPNADKSPVEKNPKSLFKISSNSGDTTLQEQPSRRSPPQTENQAAKTFWSRVASPPSLRKRRFTRKIPIFGRKPGSPEWNSTDSSFDGSKTAPSGIIDRYNLEPGEVQNHRLSCQFLPHNRPHDPSIKPLNLSDFKKYKPPLPNAESGKYSQIPIEGSLVITLYGARYIKKTVSEVYCICQVDDDVKHRIRTRIQPCRGSVAWNECYEAKLEEAYDLHITLYTWESEGKHKVLAKSTLPVSDLLCGPQGVPVKLAVKLEPRGTLYIKLSIEDPSTLEGPKVFGADIQSILDREQSGIHIPLIVRDCIREVEMRGMSVVGIYRLCGSAIAKRELRKKYENDSTSVDLSQENYPDVNVITGILKDFLRELPQPLFPPELLEAVTIAMENCTASPRLTSMSSPFLPTPPIEFPDDLAKDEDMCTGRQSVILNLIEVEKKVTLPPAEKATLYALLNHLKKVSANQEQNKMTCQNLAVCFGPVLLGSINMAPSKGMDLTAAIGFKQHIQVLNFMVSNWPSTPVPLDSPEDILIDPERNFESISEDGSRRASKRISRVSLTRRISYVFASHNGSSSSSLSGCANHDGETRNGGMVKPILSNSRKSGSLTNILESNLDISEGACGDDGFFEYQVEQDIFNEEDSADEWNTVEVPFRIGKCTSSRKSSI